MLKTFLFLILVMFMKPALAVSLMSHEKFVHLTYSEQRKIVIATMELVVEMESKYHKQVKTSGFDPERFRVYSEFMKKVSNLLFSEAHADTRNVRYGQYLNELRTVLTQTNKCLYGGWISSMVGNKCTHPSRGTSRNLYQAESGCTGGINQITCNPAIFGFKNVNAKTLFCVDAGEGKADNSSRDCMRKALAEPAEAGASSREQRIRNMVDGIAANPNDANAVFDFLLKACACDASQSRQISNHYANYMRPHQTCYSILRMMSEVTPSCQNNGQPLMDSNQLSYLSAIKESLTSTQIAEPNVADIYKAKVDQFVSRPDHQAICGPSTNGGPTVGGGTTTNPDPRCENERLVAGGLCCNPGRRPNTAGTNCEDDPTSGTDDNEGEEIVVTGQRPTPDTTTTPPDTTTTPPDTTTPGTTVTPDPVPPTTTNTCTAPKVPEGAAGACVDPCDADTQVRNAEFACVPKPETNGDEDTAVSITVTGKDKDTNTTTVTATINPADTDWNLYTLIWFSRGETRATDQNVSGTRTTPPIEDISSDNPDEETPEDKSRDLGDKESIINRDDSKTLDAPRLANDYDMCARLILKTDKSKVASESCAKIPKKPVQAPRPNGQNGPPQMGPTRGGPSDAIFRGVR